MTVQPITDEVETVGFLSPPAQQGYHPTVKENACFQGSLLGGGLQLGAANGMAHARE